MRQLLFASAVALFLAVGCAPGAGPPAQQVDPEAQRASLMEADRAFFEAVSTSENPLQTLSDHQIDDVKVLPPDAPIARGKQESLAIFAELQALPGYSLVWSPSEADVGSAGDLGYTIGTYQMAFQDPAGNPVEIDGKYMTVWKKQPDGAWKMAVDMFNSNGPPTSGED